MVQRMSARSDGTVDRLLSSKGIDEAGAARRAEFLEIASDVFAKRGYEAPSVAELAAAFGLQKATFYHYFESKEALLQAVLRSGIDRIYDEAVQIVAANADPVERLNALLACHARHVVQEGSRVVVYLVERQVLSPAFQKEYLRLRRQYDDLFVATIQEGQRQRLIRQGDARLMAYGLIGMYNWLVQWYQPSGARTIEQIYDIFCGIAFHGVLEPQGTEVVTVPTLKGRHRRARKPQT